MASSTPLFHGVQLRPLQRHPCSRGATTEIYRQAWLDGPALPQWNVIESLAGSLRGMQVHLHRVDYLAPLRGSLIAGLYDLRPDSPTHGRSCLRPLHADDQQVLIIPTGVLHGFFFPEDSLYLQGMSTPWNGEDDLRCHWNDPMLRLDWPTQTPVLSELDRAAAPLAAIAPPFHARWQSQ